jgi:CRP/FNR family transcriptional regulator, cyclic AMP receptor protein
MATFTREAPAAKSWSNESLLELDPDLCGDLSPDEADAVASLLGVRCLTLATGPWEPWDAMGSEQLALLVVRGHVAASLTVADRRHLEILGPGDVCQPWLEGSAEASIPSAPGWRVLQDAQVAILDRRFALAAARCPALMRSLVQRLVLRSRRLLFQLTVLSVPQITRRIELVMWHFAERWGRVTPHGILLELPLSHGMLAEVVASQRPSVTTALGELRIRRRLDRRDDGTWVLAHDPPDALWPLYPETSLGGLPPD